MVESLAGFMFFILFLLFLGLLLAGLYSIFCYFEDELKVNNPLKSLLIKILGKKDKPHEGE